jgi:transposase
MRKMQEYRLKGKQIFIGLEDSKRTWKLCVRSQGMIVHETGMPAKFAVLQEYLRNNYPDCRIKLLYEAGFGGFWLNDLLEENGIECIVTPAHKVTQEKVNKVKTDRVDARRLALNLENADYVVCAVPDRERREDRQISRTLSQMQDKIISTKNQIRRLFDYHGLNEDYPAGAWERSHYESLKSLKLSKPLQMCLSAYLSLLETLEKLQANLLLQLKELTRKERYCESVKLKESCPGIGWLTAIRLTLEWGDLTRFAGGKQLASYTGLTSSEYSTGETIHRGRITGQGSGRIRGWLIQCAWRAIVLDPVMLNKFQRVWKNSGSKKKGIVAVARKLAVRIRALELSKQPYAIGVIE